MQNVNAANVADLMPHDAGGCALVPVLVRQRAERAAQAVEPAALSGQPARCAEHVEPCGHVILVQQLAALAAPRLFDVRPTLAGEKDERGRGEHLGTDAALGVVVENVPQRLDGFRPQRHAPIGARLASRVVDPPAFQVDHGTRQGGHIGIAEPAVQRQQDHRPHGAVGLGEQLADLGGREQLDPVPLPVLLSVEPEIHLAGRVELVPVVGFRQSEGRAAGPVEHAADGADEFLEPVGPEALRPGEPHAGEVQRGKLIDAGLVADDIGEVGQRPLVLVIGTLADPGAALALEEMVAQVLDLDRGGCDRRRLPEGAEVLFVIVVGGFGRGGDRETANPLGLAVHFLVPSAAGLREPVLGGTQCHELRSRLRTAEKLSKNGGESALCGPGARRLQIRYSPVRIRPRPLQNVPVKPSENKPKPLAGARRAVAGSYRWKPPYGLGNRGSSYAAVTRPCFNLSTASPATPGRFSPPQPAKLRPNGGTKGSRLDYRRERGRR